MSEFNRIRYRIIVQFKQMNSFRTDNATEVACIKDLMIEGALQASFSSNSDGSETATVIMITKYGYSLIENFIQNTSSPTATNDAIREMAEREQVASDKAFDNMLLKVTMAALGIQFGMLPVLQKCQLNDMVARVVFWLITACLGACVVLMAISHLTSKKAFAAVAEHHERKCMLYNRITKLLNEIDLVAFSLAIACFVAFVVRISPKIIGG